MEVCSLNNLANYGYHWATVDAPGMFHFQGGTKIWMIGLALYVD